MFCEAANYNHPRVCQIFCHGSFHKSLNAWCKTKAQYKETSILCTVQQNPEGISHPIHQYNSPQYILHGFPSGRKGGLFG